MCNRSLVYTTYPAGVPVHFSVKFHKTNPGIQFDVGNKNKVIESGEAVVRMFRNLNNCLFCNIFLDLETIQTGKHDYKNRFSSVRKHYKDKVFRFINERLDLHSSNNGKNSYHNSIGVSGWKIHGLEDDLLFYFVQRNFFNKITATNIIRTAGLQFSTARGLKSLENYKDDSENFFRKVNESDNMQFLNEAFKE